jgi:ribosomal protein S18 acetylase RimI-like enzyme
MSWREISEEDLPWVKTFLRENVQSAMFFLSNLTTHGLGSDAPNGMRVWALTGDARGLIGLSNDGIIHILAPDATASDWQSAKPLWQGRYLYGVLGESDQSEGFLDATGLQDQPMAMAGAEPSYGLALADLRMPASDGISLIPITEDTRALAIAWRASFRGEAMGTPAAQRVEKASADVSGFILKDSHRLLVQDGMPMAMTGFNARLPDIVQIGSVYTPPETRGRGLARRAVAMHLAEVRPQGVTQAVLCAANDAAARAYEAIGFEKTGSFTMTLFQEGVGA